MHSDLYLHGCRSMLSSALNQSVSKGSCHVSRATVDAQLCKEIARVRARGVNANLLAIGDFFSGQTFDEESQQIMLSW